MPAFDLFLYALAIIAVLLLRAEPTPVATEPAPIKDDLPTLPELLTDTADLVAQPIPAVAAAITEPTAAAVVKVATEGTDYTAMSSAQLPLIPGGD